MTFPLSEELIQDILQALENQEQTFLVDAKNLCLVCSTDYKGDDEFYYILPEWKSAEGFELREDFVSTLHSPIAKDELQRILHSGRGVFRSFKNTLKEYPEVEKLWHQFKNKKMRHYINDWYNGLREIWGLETLDEEPEDNEDLIKDDFIFQEYSSENYQELIHIFSNAAHGELNTEIPGELQEVFFELWQKQFMDAQSFNQTGFICRTLSTEFVGCISAAPALHRNDKISVLTSFYVSPNYRGLGIGTQLLSMYLNALKDRKKKWILITNTIVPETLEPLLQRYGFEKTGSGFLAKIQ